MQAVPAAAVSVAHRSLPDIAPGLKPDAVTICLCYQYKEPAWNAKQHTAAMRKVIALANEHGVTGRGRCAPEGLNCTLTASAGSMRAFCYALREWDPVFCETDFKLTDGLERSSRFRSFSLRKTEELVNYGLSGTKAPSINRHAGLHLEATDYHEAMKQKDTVIIDVRNAYESAIGHFAPPEGGATLIDPKMRNSSDFPKWLNAPETKAKLQGKNVMMYCTGGIRCERATALLNQMTEADESFSVKKTIHCRGGIERYLRTFPKGGYWKGKNYLFDRRREQVPEEKGADALAADVESACCVCKRPWSMYLGQFACATCKVPVIVCDRCNPAAKADSTILECPLCEEGYEAPTLAPDLLGQKRKLGVIEAGTDMVTGVVVDADVAARVKAEKRAEKSNKEPSTRLFLGRLPRVITAAALRRALVRAAGDVETRTVRWVVDRDSGAYYGSAFVEMATLAHAKKVVAAVEKASGLAVDIGLTTAATAAPRAFATSSAPCRAAGKKQKVCAGPKKARVAFAPLRKEETWPPAGHVETEYPPLGTVLS